MQTFTLTTGGWLRRLLARNPLLRISDRIEAAALAVVLVVAILAVPVAGAVGTAVYDSRAHALAAQRGNVRAVEATAAGDTTVTRLPYQSSLLTPMRWQFDGRNHTDNVFTSKEMKTGERTAIWVDSSGAQTRAPQSGSEAAVEGAIAALGLWTVLTGGCAGLWALLRGRLNRTRYAAWDRALVDLADNKGRRHRNA